MRLDRRALFLAGFSALWAVGETAVPSSGVSLYQVVWTRYAVHLAALLILFAPRQGVAALVRTPRLGRQIGRSLLMLGMPLSFIFGMSRMPHGNMLGVFWVAPILIVAFAVVRRESFGGIATLASLAAGLLGAWLVLRPDRDILTVDAVFPMAMALCLALYVRVTGQMRHEAILPKLIHTALWVFIALGLALPFYWITPSASGWLSLVAIGLLGLVGLYLLDRAVDAERPAALAPVLYLTVVFDVLLRWGLRGTTPSRLGLLGILLIGLAVVPVLLGVGRREDTTKPVS